MSNDEQTPPPDKPCPFTAIAADGNPEGARVMAECFAGAIDWTGASDSRTEACYTDATPRLPGLEGMYFYGYHGPDGFYDLKAKAAAYLKSLDETEPREPEETYYELESLSDHDETQQRAALKRISDAINGMSPSPIENPRTDFKLVAEVRARLGVPEGDFTVEGRGQVLDFLRGALLHYGRHIFDMDAAAARAKAGEIAVELLGLGEPEETPDAPTSKVLGDNEGLPEPRFQRAMRYASLDHDAAVKAGDVHMCEHAHRRFMDLMKEEGLAADDNEACQGSYNPGTSKVLDDNDALCGREREIREARNAVVEAALSCRSLDLGPAADHYLLHTAIEALRKFESPLPTQDALKDRLIRLLDGMTGCGYAHVAGAIYADALRNVAKQLRTSINPCEIRASAAAEFERQADEIEARPGVTP